MKFSKLALSLYVLLIFASGVAVGIFAFRLYTVNSVAANAPRSPEEWRAPFAWTDAGAGELVDVGDGHRVRMQGATARERALA